MQARTSKKPRVADGGCARVAAQAGRCPAHKVGHDTFEDLVFVVGVEGPEARLQAL